jgi:hypothetical protein
LHGNLSFFNGWLLLLIVILQDYVVQNACAMGFVSDKDGLKTLQRASVKVQLEKIIPETERWIAQEVR